MSYILRITGSSTRTIVHDTCMYIPLPVPWCQSVCQRGFYSSAGIPVDITRHSSTRVIVPGTSFRYSTSSSTGTRDSSVPEMGREEWSCTTPNLNGAPVRK